MQNAAAESFLKHVNANRSVNQTYFGCTPTLKAPRHGPCLENVHFIKVHQQQKKQKQATFSHKNKDGKHSGIAQR